MKKRLIGILLSLGIVFSSLGFLNQASSYFSDVVNGNATATAGSVDLRIDQFMIGTANGTSWDLHTLGVDHRFNVDLAVEDVVVVTFVIQNTSNEDVSVNANLEMSWLDSVNETNRLFFFPVSYANASIQSFIHNNDDSAALIGFNGDDTHYNTTSQGTMQGYRYTLENTPFTLTASGATSSMRFTYKLYFTGVKSSIGSIAETLNNLPLELRVNASIVGRETEWAARTYDYGLVNTLAEIPGDDVSITILGNNPMYVTQNSVFTDPGATAVDQFDNPLTVSTSGSVNTAVYGQYTITYAATKGAVTKTSTRTVYVTDGEAPVITPVSSTIERFIDPAISLASYVTLSDNVDSAAVLGANLQITTPAGYDPEKAGTYIITYNVKDSSGLSAQTKTIELKLFAFKKVKTEVDSTFAMTTNGKVYSWGYNGSYELGNNDTNSRFVPTLVQGLSDVNVVDIAGGQYSAFALTDTGDVYSWGYDGNGAQGNGSGGNNQIATKITTLSNVVWIAANYYTAFAVTASGAAYSWGYGGNYVSGINTTATQQSPVLMTFPGNPVIKRIFAGWRQGFAISADNKLFAWGHSGQYQQLGTSTATTQTPVDITNRLPTAISVSNINDLSTGEGHVMLLLNSGVLYTWGYNSNGQVGNNSTTTVQTPLIPNGLNGVVITSIKAGYLNSMAVSSTGTLYVFGENLNNALGTAATGNKLVPTTITQTSIGLVKDGAPFYGHSSLLTTKGYVYTVGSNAYGKLGINSTTSQSSFVKVVAPT